MGHFGDGRALGNGKSSERAAYMYACDRRMSEAAAQRRTERADVISR